MLARTNTQANGNTDPDQPFATLQSLVLFTSHMHLCIASPFWAILGSVKTGRHCHRLNLRMGSLDTPAVTCESFCHDDIVSRSTLTSLCTSLQPWQCIQVIFAWYARQAKRTCSGQWAGSVASMRSTSWYNPHQSSSDQL